MPGMVMSRGSPRRLRNLSMSSSALVRSSAGRRSSSISISTGHPGYRRPAGSQDSAGPPHRRRPLSRVPCSRRKPRIWLITACARADQPLAHAVGACRSSCRGSSSARSLVAAGRPASSASRSRSCSTDEGSRTGPGSAHVVPSGHLPADVVAPQQASCDRQWKGAKRRSSWPWTLLPEHDAPRPRSVS